MVTGKAYIRPNSASIDAWGTVNNAGWSWNTLFPYFKSSEHLNTPTSDQEALGNTFEEGFHGFNGSVQTSFPQVGAPEFLDILEKTYDVYGIPRIRDFNGGNARGLCTYPATFTNAGNSSMQVQLRASANENYYLPAVNRPNLELIASTTCMSLVWANKTGSGSPLMAKEVKIGNETFTNTVHAKREVILSAGAYRSSVILEYSGIGNPSILAQNNVESTLNLPGVGENLQDQFVGNIQYQKSLTQNISYPKPFDGSITTNYIVHITADDIWGAANASETAASLKASLPEMAANISDRINNALSAAQIEKSLNVQYDAIFTHKVPAVEMFSDQNQGATGNVILEFWPLIPFNRGNVHLSGPDPLNNSLPTIDPNWGMFDYDWRLYIDSARYVRQLFRTSPLKDIVADESRPGRGSVPDDATDEQWKTFFKPGFRAGWHPVGTCAMLPQEWGGVVDGDLKVYGTGNVRVVDASVIPFMLGGHPSSIIYALAERAADLIISGAKG